MKLSKKIKQYRKLSRLSYRLKIINPKFFLGLKKKYENKAYNLEKQLAYEISEACPRCCHTEELFIRTNGDIYPCCLIWSDNDLKIAHLDDEDIEEKILNYKGACHCKRFKLIPSNKTNKQYKLLNIELSYVCQASCAMCCVFAPDNKENLNYKYFEKLSKLINKLQPEKIRVQGGEVLIQEKSIEWLKALREKHPKMEFSIVTNGNVDNSKIETAISLFDRFYISIVGFQPETYKTIMGMNLNKVKNFAEKVIESNKSQVHLKYLITPNNLHETSLFLDWAIKLIPDYIILADANSKSYMKFDTFDNYWNKMLERTEKEVKDILKKHREFLLENKAVLDEKIPFENTVRPIIKSKRTLILNDKRFKAIEFESTSRELFDINQEFLNENNLNKLVRLVDY